MYPAHRIDLSADDLAFALGACAWARDRDGLAARLERGWSDEGLACLSVRSAFDLWLSACAFDPGDEIVFSAINVADMPRIARTHGLTVLPAELEPDTLVPSAARIERLLTPRTRAVVIAQLFGSRTDLSPIADVLRRRGVLLVEDCAQGFRGPRALGDPSADVSLFSFGTIKTATALGGALARVRDAKTRARMRARQATWPVQARALYRQKVVKYTALLGASDPRAYTWFSRGCAALGRDLDDVTRELMKGFAGAELFPQIRVQPSAPLLALLERRLCTFDGARLAARAAYGERVARSLPRGLVHAGGRLDSHTHWVLTATTPDPDVVTRALRRVGFHATRRGASLEAIAPPHGRDDLAPTFSRGLMRDLVFLPAYPEIPEGDLGRMIDALGALTLT